MRETHVPHHSLHPENSECPRNHYQHGQRLYHCHLHLTVGLAHTGLNRVVSPACRFRDMLIFLQFVCFRTPPFWGQFETFWSLMFAIFIATYMMLCLPNTFLPERF